VTPAEEKHLSRFLSLALRHDPTAADITLDAAGWILIEDLIQWATRMGQPLTRDQILQIVANSDKQRFTISADGRSLRAAQGHSVPVDLGLEHRTPPETLFHGTADISVPTILREGLKPQSRQHVHLSSDTTTARQVGRRHGRPVVLEIQAKAAHAAGQPFWISENGVWLTTSISPKFLHPQADKF